MANKELQVVQSGERTNTEGKPVSNLLLLSISDSDYSSLRPHLEYVSLPNHLVLHEGGGKLEFAYFPNRGLISLVVVMKDGKTAEAGIVGNEGFTGTLPAHSRHSENHTVFPETQCFCRVSYICFTAATRKHRDART